MFYPVESLKRGGRFYLCWVADSWPLRFATITQKQLWSQDIRIICDDLQEVMNNESGRQAKRFSLRLSSQLLRGLVRLYQRKVTVLVGDLCMINAHVMKLTKKKWNPEVNVSETRENQLVHPIIVLEDQELEERVAERIQNSGNVVANIDDITLKEQIIPEMLLVDDGFGELGERSVEAMLGGQTAASLSVLMTDASSRLDISRDRLALPQNMESVLEQDTTLFSKSMGEVPLPGDLYKDIPEIPEILPPELPVPEPLNIQTTETGFESPKSPTRAEETLKELDQIILEELQEEPQAKRRRLKKKLIVDKHIKLSAPYMLSRIQNVHVEQRCKDSADDVIGLLVPASTLLSRGAHAGVRASSNLGSVCSMLTYRGLTPRKGFPHDEEVQEALMAEPKDSNTHSRLDVIEEYPREAITGQPEMMDTAVAPEQSALEFSELPTQKLTVSPLKRRSGVDITPKPVLHCGVMSYKKSKIYEVFLGTNKENVPVHGNIPAIECMQVEQLAVPVADNRDRLTEMLEAEGLADSKEVGIQEKEVPQARVTRHCSDSSETQLGSLDRTKVSLGDSEATTDSRRFLREEWGTQGTMHKIYNLVKEGVQPLTVKEIVAKGPFIPGRKRITAARCFASILNLKEHGFVNVSKNTETCEIENITLGDKIKKK